MTDFTPCPRTVEMCAEVALTAKLPRERLSCGDDESGIMLSLQRQRRHTAQAIRALIKETNDERSFMDDISG